MLNDIQITSDYMSRWVVLKRRVGAVTSQRVLKVLFYVNISPYNRLSGQQILSGTQIISTSHGMTVRNFFDVFLPFYLLLKLPIKKLLVFFFRSTRITRSISDSLFELI